MENLQNFVSKSFVGDRIPTAIRKEHISFSVEDLLATPHDEAFSSGEDEGEDGDISAERRETETATSARSLGCGSQLSARTTAVRGVSLFTTGAINHNSFSCAASSSVGLSNNYSTQSYDSTQKEAKEMLQTAVKHNSSTIEEPTHTDTTAVSVQRDYISSVTVDAVSDNTTTASVLEGKISGSLAHDTVKLSKLYKKGQDHGYSSNVQRMLDKSSVDLGNTTNTLRKDTDSDTEAGQLVHS